MDGLGRSDDWLEKLADMSDGITDGNRQSALADVLEHELNGYKAYGIVPSLTPKQAMEALENCRELERLRGSMISVRKAVDLAETSYAEAIDWLKRIVA